MRSIKMRFAKLSSHHQLQKTTIKLSNMTLRSLFAFRLTRLHFCLLLQLRNVG